MQAHDQALDIRAGAQLRGAHAGSAETLIGEARVDTPPRSRAPGADRTIRVLFLQSHREFSSAAAVHRLMMREFDAERVEVHFAVEADADEAPAGLRVMPGVVVKPTRFVPTMYLRSRHEIVTAVARGGLSAAVDLAGLIRYARRHQIDIVHFDERPRNALYGLAVGRAVGATTVLHLHSTPGVGSISEKSVWCMRHADAVIGVSHHVASVAIDRGVSAQRVHVVWSGIDLATWDPTIDGGAVREEFGIGPHELVLAIVARIVPWKGHPELLGALGRVAHRVGPFRVLIVGPEDYAPALPAGTVSALREQASRLGIEDRIIFTGKRSDVAHLLAASDIYAMPSHTEAFGLVFAEAMAMGVPSVAFDVGGVGEVVEHGRTGLLSAPHDVDELAENIALLATDATLRRAMGQAGRERVAREFTPSRMAHETTEVYRSVLASAQSR